MIITSYTMLLDLYEMKMKWHKIYYFIVKLAITTCCEILLKKYTYKPPTINIILQK